jgi:hypothetical protein
MNLDRAFLMDFYLLDDLMEQLFQNLLIVNIQLCKQRDLLLKGTELFFRVFLSFKNGLKFDLPLSECLLLRQNTFILGGKLFKGYSFANKTMFLICVLFSCNISEEILTSSCSVTWIHRPFTSILLMKLLLHRNYHYEPYKGSIRTDISGVTLDD